MTKVISIVGRQKRTLPVETSTTGCVAKLADALDSKSNEAYPSSRFDPEHSHQLTDITEYKNAQELHRAFPGISFSDFWKAWR